MKKFFVNCLCAFIPNTDKRRAFRKKLMRDRIAEIASQFEFLDRRINENNEKIAELNKAVARLDVEKQNVFHAPTEYVFHGENNKLLVWDNDKNDYVERNKKIIGLNITINGNNNKIFIDDINIFQNLLISLDGYNHRVHIGKDLHNYHCVIKNTAILLFYHDCEIDIGDNIHIEHNCCISLCEPQVKCKIGKNVRFAENVRCFVGDAHPIVDINTNKIVNYAQGNRLVNIGNNCWIGMYSFVGKNAKLADFTIVGAYSVITKGFDESYIAIAGNPAKIIKRGVMRVDLWEDALKRYAV